MAILVLITITLAACPANYNIDNLLAGIRVPSLRFSHLLSEWQLFIYLSKLQLSLLKEFCRYTITCNWYSLIYSAVQDFSLNYVAANSFAVYPSSVKSTAIAFQFDYSQPVWSKVKINFWASNNNQVQLGYFKLGTSLLIQIMFNSMEAATALLLTPLSTEPSRMEKTLSSEFSSTVTISNLMSSKFQSAPPTFKIPNLQLKSLWVHKPHSSVFGSVGLHFPQLPPPSDHMEGKSQNQNIPAVLAQMLATLSISLLMSSTVLLYSPLFPVMESHFLHQ